MLSPATRAIAYTDACMQAVACITKRLLMGISVTSA
jgi:hypothetical protein